MQKTPLQQGHACSRPPSDGSGPGPTQSCTALDLCTALYLVAVAVSESGDEVDEGFAPYEPDPDTAVYASHGAPRSLVGHALFLAGVDVADLEAMRGSRLRDLFARGRLPVTMTLGAVAVLDAAGLGTARRDQWRRGLAQASTAAARYLDLLPDLALDSEGQLPFASGWR